MRTAVIVFVAALLCACGKGRQGTASSEAVGKVTAVTGQVTAKRGAAPRPLAVGDTVYADDVVTTAAGASVELTFKQGVFALESGRIRAVTEILAMMASMGSGGSAGTDDPTSAAGRHAESNAAETPNTMGKPGDAKGGSSPPQLPPTGQPPPDQAPEPKKVDPTIGKPGGEVDAEGGLDPAVAKQAVRKVQPAIVRCYQNGLKADPTLGGKVRFELHFAKSGKVVKAILDSSNLGVEAVEQCMLTALQQVTVPAMPSEASVTIPFDFKASP